jgi:hypothetical protein
MVHWWALRLAACGIMLAANITDGGRLIGGRRSSCRNDFWSIESIARVLDYPVIGFPRLGNGISNFASYRTRLHHQHSKILHKTPEWPETLLNSI